MVLCCRYVDPVSREHEVVENEEVMQDVWRSKVMDDVLKLACFAKQ